MQALSQESSLRKSRVNLTQGFLVLFGCLVLFGSRAPVNAQGFGSVQLVVTDQSEVPIPQANLCFVLSNQTIGGKQTDATGRFNASLPSGAATVHVFKQGFLNSQQDFNITNGGNLVHQFRLQPGTATAPPPGCTTILGAASSTGPDFINITGFHVVGNSTSTNPTVTLRATFDSYPRAYRIREFTAEERYPEDSFNPERAFQRLNVPWLSMPPGHLAREGDTLEIEFNLSPDAFGPQQSFGTHVIYLEVAKVALANPNGSVIAGTAGGISSPKGVSVVLAPAKFKTFTLTGTALQTFIQQARDRGYTFSVSEDRVLATDYCAANSMILVANGDTAISDTAVEIIRGSFEVFAGPDLNPYWKLKSINASHADFPNPPVVSLTINGSHRALVITEDVTGSGGPNSIKRTFQWRRTVYPILAWGQYSVGGGFRTTDVQCILRKPNQAALTEVVLEGPDGKNPIDALPRRP